MLINAAVRQYYLNCSNEIVGLFKSDSIRGKFIGNITDVDITTRVLPWVNKMVVLSLPPVAFPHMRLICRSCNYSIVVTGLVANGCDGHSKYMEQSTVLHVTNISIQDNIRAFFK